MEPKHGAKADKTRSPVSSCEITADYRSRLSDISGDPLSGRLVTEAGKKTAQEFIHTHQYPLAPRKIAVIAGFFLREAGGLLRTGGFDSCISFASGLSLLLYQLTADDSISTEIIYIDSDLPEVIALREERIKEMQNEIGLDPARVARIQSMAFDIEQAYENGRKLKEVFPKCKRPLFILDGVSYFLSEGCVEWLMEQMADFEHSAVMMYYWPDTMAEESACFRRFRGTLGSGDFREPIVHFWNNITKEKFAQSFPSDCQHLTLTEVEDTLLPEDAKRELTDPNQFFPVRVARGQKKTTTNDTAGSVGGCCVVS